MNLIYKCYCQSKKMKCHEKRRPNDIDNFRGSYWKNQNDVVGSLGVKDDDRTSTYSSLRRGQGIQK